MTRVRARTRVYAGTCDLSNSRAKLQGMMNDAQRMRGGCGEGGASLLEAAEAAARHSVRAGAAMDDVSRYAHERLEEWARWAKDSQPKPWPAATLLSRVMDGGTQGAIAHGKVSLEMPKHIEQVDSIVLQLEEIEIAVTRKYYLEWAPIDVLAAALCLRVTRFNFVIKGARRKVGMALIFLRASKILI